jgi:hypothetical protein
MHIGGMKHPNAPRISRRGFVQSVCLATAAGALTIREAVSDELPRLDVKDPAAMAVGYVENASEVNRKKYPAYVQGANCENCLQLQGKAGDTYRPCSLFPGKVVAVSGWCSGWTAEM